LSVLMTSAVMLSVIMLSVAMLNALASLLSIFFLCGSSHDRFYPANCFYQFFVHLISFKRLFFQSIEFHSHVQISSPILHCDLALYGIIPTSENRPHSEEGVLRFSEARGSLSCAKRIMKSDV
jgi:hypothetical protein